MKLKVGIRTSLYAAAVLTATTALGIRSASAAGVCEQPSVIALVNGNIITINPLTIVDGRIVYSHGTVH